MTLEQAIIDLISYLDTLDQEQGDNIQLYMNWGRAGNNRRKTMIRNGSSFLTLSCHASIKLPDPKRTHIWKFCHLSGEGETPTESVLSCHQNIREYIELVYGENNSK